MMLCSIKDIVPIIKTCAADTTFDNGQIAVLLFKDNNFKVNVYIICLEGSVINHIFTIDYIEDKIKSSEYFDITVKSIAGDVEHQVKSATNNALDKIYYTVTWNKEPIIGGTGMYPKHK